MKVVNAQKSVGITHIYTFLHIFGIRKKTEKYTVSRIEINFLLIYGKKLKML